jgi:hypothetical protein
VSDHILPSQNPKPSASPEHADVLPEQPATNGTPSENGGSDSAPDTRIPPELHDWFMQQLPPIEELEREIRELQEHGGLAFEDFFDDLVEAVRNGRDYVA